MDLIDRELQRNLLVELAKAYPKTCQSGQLGYGNGDSVWNFATQYLKEHGLVEADGIPTLDGGYLTPGARITAKGLDFLQDDGGLTAILGVVTVRLDAETIRAMIEDKIEATIMPAEEKSRLTRWLSTAGTEALKEATKRLVGAALDHAPDALRLLQTLPG